MVMSKILMRFTAYATLIILFVAVFAYSQLQRYLDAPMAVPADGFEYSLPRGGSLGSAAYALAKQGVLESPRYLTLFSRLTGRGSSIKAGDYLLDAGITPRQLLDKFERGDVQYFQLTLVEGWNLTQVMAAVRAQHKLVRVLDANASIVKPGQLDIDTEHASLEGLLFPDTYHYHSHTTDIELLQQAHQRLISVLESEWQTRDDNLPYKNAYEALIMASLVEKETGVASERAQIAGVFVRRLQKGMRLQTDPSIIYGLGADFDGNLRSRHLKDSANIYNTYRHNGLTPTPIALAGREAIHAALHPAEGDSLYFVAKGDGTHYFSKTLEEHQRAVRKYQIRQRRKDYSSVPKTKTST